jgi:hypothetical protein
VIAPPREGYSSGRHVTAQGRSARPAGKGQVWLARGLVAAGLGMLPWLGVLAATLPASARAAHWPAAWIGLDSMEALGLLSTGLLLIRRKDYCSLTAAVTAALVLADAWFDVTTAAPGADQVIAIAMAAGIEIPVSLLCACVAVHAFPRWPAGSLATPTPPSASSASSASSSASELHASSPPFVAYANFGTHMVRKEFGTCEISSRSGV